MYLTSLSIPGNNPHQTHAELLQSIRYANCIHLREALPLTPYGQQARTREENGQADT